MGGNALNATERSEIVYRHIAGWECRLTSAELLCGGDTITPNDVDAIKYAVVILNRIKEGESITVNIRDATDLIEEGKRIKDEYATLCGEWTLRALNNLQKAMK